MDKNNTLTGHYVVNNTAYLNKYKALENCEHGHWPEWDFHNEAYSNEPWYTEPHESLYELYKQRALQLREQYDYLLLYFSGGVDSLAVLRSFVDNNIELDGIIVTGCFDMSDTVSKQCNVEQSFVALPYLESLRAQKRLNCPVHMMDTAKYFKFDEKEWVYSFTGVQLTPQVFSSNFYWEDPWIQSFMMKGNTGLIKGIDKPRVILEDGKWYAGFLDSSMAGSVSTDQLNNHSDRDNNEYFYWTPDFTSIVNKQAHMCINWFENNLSKEECGVVTSKNASFNRTKYINYVDPLVYGNYIDQKPGEERSYITVGKPLTSQLEHKDFWFTDTRTEHLSSFNAWVEGLKMLSEKIPQQYFNRVSHSSSEYNHFLKSRNLENVFNNNSISNVLAGVVGSWSKLHYIRDFNDN